MRAPPLPPHRLGDGHVTVGSLPWPVRRRKGRDRVRIEHISPAGEKMSPPTASYAKVGEHYLSGVSEGDSGCEVLTVRVCVRY